MTGTYIAALVRSLAYDVRHTCRNLRRYPVFSIASVSLLTIGIGGTTLVFSVIEAILLRELPLNAPDRLARIVELTHNRPPVSEYPYRIFDKFRRTSRSFSSVFAQSEVDIAYSDERTSRPVRAQIVTGNYYPTLGVEAFRVRLLTNKDEWATGGELPVVLSYRFCQQQFQTDENVLGRVVHLEGRPFIVVGVTKPDFNGISVDTGPDIQVPFIAGEFLTIGGTKKSDPPQLLFVGNRRTPKPRCEVRASADGDDSNDAGRLGKRLFRKEAAVHAGSRMDSPAAVASRAN